MYSANLAVNAGVIAASVKMHDAANSRRAQILVEGPTDQRFWEARSNGTTCLVLHCGSKDTVVKAVLKLAATHIKRVFGIIDDDHDRFFVRSLPAGNIFRTDESDLESMMLASRALDRVLVEICDRDAIKAYEATSGLTVRQALESRALVFGELRYISREQSFLVDFKRLSPWRFVDRGTWQLDRSLLVTEFSGLAGITVDDTEAFIAALPQRPIWQLIQGHDAIQVLRIGLDGVLGGSIREEAALTAVLRLAYDLTLLSSTNIYADIVCWQVSTSSRVFA